MILVAGTLTTSGIVGAQSSLGNWNVIATGVVPFVVFMIAATAELNRPPFDLVEAEQELVGGFNTEYSAFRFALFFLAEFMNTVTMSARHRHPVLRRPAAGQLRRHSLDRPYLGAVQRAPCGSSLKLLVFLYIYVWFRATLPRLRYDQLMNLGWKLLIPRRPRLVHAARRGPASASDQNWNTWLVGASASSSSPPCAGCWSPPAGSAHEPRARRGDVLMGYLGGFLVTARPAPAVRRQAVTTDVLGRPGR